MISIAIIPPFKNSDFLADTIIDGILDLMSSGVSINLKILEFYPGNFKEDLDCYFLKTQEFIDFAKNEADIVFLCLRYKELNLEIAEKINEWRKTVFVDGSEYKHDNRFNFDIQYNTLKNKNIGPGAVNIDIYEKAGIYLRREKPYLKDMIPFPFGLERRYRQYDSKIKKDIDFVCIFGQETYPKMRMYCKNILEDFCKKNNLVCRTKKSDGFFYDLTKKAGRDDFYNILARSKIGISVGGGGFDTLRFWETLANNCLLLTEKIDIYPINSKRLKYERIFEFANLFDFQFQLENLLPKLMYEYNENLNNIEFERVIKDHSTRSRVIEIFLEAQKRNILKIDVDWNKYK